VDTLDVSPLVSVPLLIFVTAETHYTAPQLKRIVKGSSGAVVPDAPTALTVGKASLTRRKKSLSVIAAAIRCSALLLSASVQRGPNAPSSANHKTT
jgi:hypothetical protein